MPIWQTVIQTIHWCSITDKLDKMLRLKIRVIFCDYGGGKKRFRVERHLFTAKGVFLYSHSEEHIVLKRYSTE